MENRRLTLMAVHAHPDDEATGTGGILAMYSAQGMQTVLVTCTDGACGDGPGGVKPGQEGHDPASVVEMRRAELERSCGALGVTHLEMLGYADSGMQGWPQNDAPNSFWRTPVEQSAARLAELFRAYRPDVVVTYDANGFYGHPDHIQAHRVTMAAEELTGIPAKVYWTTAPRSRMAQFVQTMREYGADWDEPEPDAGQQPRDSAQPPDIGVPDEQISAWVDTSAYGGQKFDALAAHASQSDNIFFLRLGREKFTELMGMETFIRAADRTGASTPEDDLFAGLR